MADLDEILTRIERERARLAADRRLKGWIDAAST